MEDYAPYAFLGSWVLVIPYLCYRFCIFDRPILEEYVSQIEGHLLQSCLHAMQYDLLCATKEMHLFFESLAIIGAPSLQASLMDIHHDTSFRSILEDDSISLTFRALTRFCQSKGAKLWLVARPFIHSFHIAHSSFTSMLHFSLDLIQPLGSTLFICECGYDLDASGTHLACCPFRGQRIVTHDTI